MLSPDAFLKGVAAVVCGAFGLLLVGLGGRGRRRRLLGAFLVLIAGNQAAEAVRSAAGPGAVALGAFRVATVCAALDPLVLFLALARPGDRRARAVVVLVAAASATFVAVALGAPGAWLSTPGVGDALVAFTAVAYLVVLALSFGEVIEDPDRGSGRFLLAALVVAIVPVLVAALSMATVRAMGAAGLRTAVAYLPETLGDAVGLAAACVAGGLAWRRLARADEAPARTFLAALAVGAALTLLLRAFHVVEVLGVHGAVEAVSVNLGRGGAAIRWLLFGSLASVALIRFEDAGMSVAERRRSARVLAALGILTLATTILAAAHALAGAQDAPLTPTEAVLLLGVLALSQGFRAIVDRVAHLVYGLAIPGRAADPGAPLRVGALVQERYRVDAFLGRGGSGRVYRVHDQLLRRDVVVKELLCEDEAATDHLLHEARVASAARHANVVAVHDVICRAGSVLIVQEYVEGGTLAAHLASGAVEPAAGAAILDDVLHGLAALHAKGIVHGDLNPNNVLLTLEGRAKIADFGLSGPARHTVELGVLPRAAGTPGYLSPEVLQGAGRTAASDVYAAGVLARDLMGDAAGADEALRRALDPDPRRRWPDAGAMLAAMRERSPHVQ